MKIGKIELENNLILAPMAGYSDVGFRDICQRFGASMTVTEMVSAKGLIYNSEKTESLLYRSKNERVVSAQIFGSDPYIMAEACNHKSLSKFDIIDINMGCPAPKITKNGEGSALLKNIELAEKIIDTCVKNSPKPITVKMRLGYSKDKLVAVDFAKMCEELKVSAITVHGRTTEQGYSGESSFEEIARVRESVKNITVIGNGDVRDKLSYEKMLSTKVDGVMIGRGALGNPYIFSDLQNKEYPDIKNPALEQILILEDKYPEKFLVNELRKSLVYYCTKAERLILMKIDNLKDLKIFISNLEKFK